MAVSLTMIDFIRKDQTSTRTGYVFSTRYPSLVNVIRTLPFANEAVVCNRFSFITHFVQEVVWIVKVMVQESEGRGWVIFGRDGDTVQGVNYVHLTDGKKLDAGYDFRDRGVQGILLTDQF